MDIKPKTRHNLPPQPTSFIGREHEIAEITALLTNPACRLLTLTGLGGIGKTRLALEAANSQRDNFPDGVCFVPLQPLQAAGQVLSAVIEALNLQTSRDPHAELLNWLEDKHLLLVMDNFEHVVDGADLLSDILDAAPAVKILVTSRDALKLREEWVRQIHGLDYPDTAISQLYMDYSAVQLFIECARHRRGDLRLEKEHAHIVCICQLVEGMPLALELAAGWMDALTCAEIAAELERNIALLTARTHNISPRHQSIQAVFEHSWRLLTEREQAVMRRFAVFRGGCTRDAAEQVTGANLPLLAGLVEKSLLRHDPDTGRYNIHELVRQYAGEQLETSGEMDTARDAHSAYYAAFLHEQWGPLRTAQQVAVLNRIEAEFENIHAAWQTMVEKRNAAQLSLSVYPVWYYCDLRGRYHDALALFKQVEDALRPAAGDDAVDRALGQMLTRQGFFHVSTGQLQAGEALAEEGLSILQRVGTVEDLVLALVSLCMLSDRRDDYHAVDRYARQAIEVARPSDDRWLLAGASYLVACVMSSQCLDRYQVGNLDSDDLEKTKRHVEETVGLIEACGDLWMRGSFCTIPGWLAAIEGDYIEAVRWCERGVKLCEELGQVVTIAQGHNVLGTILYQIDDYSNAAPHYLHALRVLSEHGGYIVEQIRILESVAGLQGSQGDQTKAVELLTLILHHPESYPSSRSWADNMLHELQAEMPSSVFAAAQQRGRQLELKQVVRELLRELDAMTDDPAAHANQFLPDPLTPRELEVLMLICTGLSNQQIADHVVVGVSTVKTHINNLYSKLSVASRTQVILRAQELGLVSYSQPPPPPR
jgi:predicted ATPase/DNA-binding CsgD family transcriptional regulator